MPDRTQAPEPTDLLRLRHIFVILIFPILCEHSIRIPISECIVQFHWRQVLTQLCGNNATKTRPKRVGVALDKAVPIALSSVRDRMAPVLDQHPLDCVGGDGYPEFLEFALDTSVAPPGLPSDRRINS